MGNKERINQLRGYISQEKIDIIGIQETIKQDFSNKELRSLDGDNKFLWKWLPAKGHSGGILMGVKGDSLEVEDWECFTYAIKAVIRDRVSNFRWCVITVYGPANHQFSKEFLNELSYICRNEILPVILGGDFNLIREVSEKNSLLYDHKLMDSFNEFIRKFNLREIPLGGLKFTWSNKQINPVLVKLDRFLVSTEWEEKFPSCSAHGLTRVGSDHNPIIIDSRDQIHSKPRYFYFENNWFLQPGFEELVKEKWIEKLRKRPVGIYSIEGWHGSLTTLRMFLKGWHRRLLGCKNKEKNDLIQELDQIDILIEDQVNLWENWSKRLAIEKKLEHIYHLDEVFWQQRAGRKWTVKGDSNSRFFHLYANGRRRKNTIAYLETDKGVCMDQKALIAHIVNFYKILFGPNTPCNMKLSEDFWRDRSMTSKEEMESLAKPFEVSEIKQAIDQMHNESAPGPNGFGASFFKKFWNLIKEDLIMMFSDFYAGKLDIQRLNFGVITLIPKIKEASNIRQYRPICLLNVDFKIFTKVLTNRLSLVAKEVIGGSQTGFIKDRNILEGVVILHEIIHELKTKKKGV